jgi:hypothetical protein
MAVSQFFRGPLEPGYSMSWHRLTAAADLGKQMVGERTTAFHATETGRLALGYDRNGARAGIAIDGSERRLWGEQQKLSPDSTSDRLECTKRAHPD